VYVQNTLNALCAQNRYLELYVHMSRQSMLYVHTTPLIIAQLMLYVHKTNNKICVYTLYYLTSVIIKDIVTFSLTCNFNISSSQWAVWCCTNKKPRS